MSTGEIIECGDANPKGNVDFFYKGGCRKDLKIKEAYRCVGCGSRFHLDCIKKHFELEKDHDIYRQELRHQLEKCKSVMTDSQLIKAGF